MRRGLAESYGVSSRPDGTREVFELSGCFGHERANRVGIPRLRNKLHFLPVVRELLPTVEADHVRPAWGCRSISAAGGSGQGHGEAAMGVPAPEQSI